MKNPDIAFKKCPLHLQNGSVKLLGYVRIAVFGNSTDLKVKLKPESEKEYMDIHANVWPSVLAALESHHIVDYSIHYYKQMGILIANMKYTGTDYEKDMAEIAADPETKRWWAVTDSMQESLVPGATGSGQEIPWWLVSSRFDLIWVEYSIELQELDEVFRFEGRP